MFREKLWRRCQVDHVGALEFFLEINHTEGV